MTDFPPSAAPTALEALLEETEKDMLLKASQEMVGLCVFFVARRRWRLHALDAGAKRRTLARARRAPPLTALTVRTPFDSSLLRPLRSIHQSQTEKSLRSFLKKIAAKYSSMKGEGEGEKLCYAILRRKAGEAEAAAAEAAAAAAVAYIDEVPLAPPAPVFEDEVAPPVPPQHYAEGPAAYAVEAGQGGEVEGYAEEQEGEEELEPEYVPEYRVGMNGYIFCAKSDTFNECLERKLLGAPAGAGGSIIRHVAAHDTVLFLHNMSSRTIYGVFVAVSEPAYDIEPDAWVSTRSGIAFKRRATGAHSSAFPCQVRFAIGRKYKPLPISELGRAISVTGGGRFNPKLNSSQVQALLATMADHNANGPDPSAPRVQARSSGGRGRGRGRGGRGRGGRGRR